MSPIARPDRQALHGTAPVHPPWVGFGHPSSHFPPLPGANSALVELTRKLKDELARRYEQGERPSAAEYLDRYPELAADRDRAVSLIYEEYCLREEHDAAPAPEEFCRRYDAWRDSLASQLRYHRLLSSVLQPQPLPRYPIPGETFAGRYVLRDLLGEGGTSRVYLAEQPEVGHRRVALKITASTGREPAILGRLDHDHIIPIWSIEHDPETGLRGLCMPYRAGLPLDRILKRIDPLAPHARAIAFWKAIQHPTDETEPDPSHRAGWRGFPTRGSHSDAAAWITLVVARALAYAHNRGVLHRDIKPANILLTTAGPQLLDFNLADTDQDDPANAQKALQGGTLPYMAPEQLHAFLDPTRWKEVGPPADVYSLGLVLRELLTAQRPPCPPSGGVSTPRLINDLLDLRARPHRSTRLDNPAVPHALAAIVARCTAHSIADRYPSAETLAEDLERYLSRCPLRWASNPDWAERLKNHLWRNRVRLAASILMIGLAGVGVLAFQSIRAADLRVAQSVQVIASAIAQNSQAERKLAERWLDENEKDSLNVLKDPVRKARLKQIRELFERDAAADPTDYSAFLNLAHIDQTYPDPNWSDQERLERPLAHYNRALQIIQQRTDIRPKYRAEAFLNRGVMLVLQGMLFEQTARHDQAIRQFRAAINDLEQARRDQAFLDSFRRVRLLYSSASAHAQLARLLLIHGESIKGEAARVQAIAELDQLDRLLRTLADTPVSLDLLDRSLIDKFQIQAIKLRSDVEQYQGMSPPDQPIPFDRLDRFDSAHS
ncbi:MAG: hypothetical protein KatS3mg108_3549 [Isosphaeraceae bacterium]|jgi:serine/threonine protein kinase|nr:MAG: hypothetical protein KatS3mg108_3549 [Isosphaeraceae bacterium]